MSEHPPDYPDGVVVPGMKGGEAVDPPGFIQQTQVPVVERAGHAFPVGIVRVHDGLHSPGSQIVDAVPGIELVNHGQPVLSLEKPPDGLEQLIGKQMRVKVDDLFRQRKHVSSLFSPNYAKEGIISTTCWALSRDIEPGGAKSRPVYHDNLVVFGDREEMKHANHGRITVRFSHVARTLLKAGTCQRRKS